MLRTNETTMSQSSISSFAFITMRARNLSTVKIVGAILSTMARAYCSSGVCFGVWKTILIVLKEHKSTYTASNKKEVLFVSDSCDRFEICPQRGGSKSERSPHVAQFFTRTCQFSPQCCIVKSEICLFHCMIPPVVGSISRP